MFRSKCQRTCKAYITFLGTDFLSCTATYLKVGDMTCRETSILEGGGSTHQEYLLVPFLILVSSIMSSMVHSLPSTKNDCPVPIIKRIYTCFFSEMSFPRFDRLALSDGGPLLIQYISDACVSSRQNNKQFFLYLKTNKCRLRGALLSWRYMRLHCLRKVKKRKEKKKQEKKRKET